MKMPILFLNFYFLLIQISRSQLIYSNFHGTFTSASFGMLLLYQDWNIYQRDNHGYTVANCGLKSVLIMNECTNWAFNSLTSKSFELPPHYQVNLSFKLWMRSATNYFFYLYVDNELKLLIQKSLYTFTNGCTPYESYDISENIIHQSSSIQITMVSNQSSWGFSEFNLNVINTTQKIWELVYQSFNNKIFSTISVDDGWMTNNIVSQQVQQCTDFNFLRSSGTNFIKEFVLNLHKKISLNMKVLIFNQTSSTIDLKIDNQQVITKISDSYVQSSIPLCYNFTVFQVQISDFEHKNVNLRIEVLTQTDGSTSWFGIRDFSLFTDIYEDYQCKDFNIQPFDGCFSNQYDCNLGCSNCVNGICINCLDGWTLYTKNNCIPICGDQKLMLNEICDDGNSNPYDGCHNCQFSCPLNCILCTYGTCKECEKSYFLVNNRCKHGFQFDESFVEQLETGVLINWTNYLEKNGIQCQPNSQQQSILQLSQQYNLLQNNYYRLNIIQSFSVCYFPDSQIILDHEQDSQTECKKGYKFSPSKRQCVEICNCQDLVSLQNNDCNNCIQNCQLECLICLQDKCYVCLEGWQLVDNKCQQICGDNQIALHSNEQCDDGNYVIEDGCYDCLFQCGSYCQFCNKELNCLLCEANFKLAHHLCTPICGDKIVISGLEECDDGNNIKYDGCFECQFQCNFGCKICESGKCQDVCKVEEESINGECVPIVLIEIEEIDPIQPECQNDCQVCDGANCLLCKPDYILENKKCVSCGNGIVNKDEECDDGNRINSDGCSNQCKIEENWNCIESYSLLSQCSRIPRISIAFLNSTFNTQYVQLSYNNKVKLNQQENNFLDYNVNSINIGPTYYNISIFPVVEIVSNETRDINYELKIQINQQLSQNPILEVKVDLILLDENDLPVPPQSQQIELNAPLVLNQAQIEVSKNFQKFGYNIMLALGGFAIFALLLGSPQQFLEILDTLQFYSYLKFINVEYPENLNIYFQSSELISVDPILQFLGIKDNFENQLGINIIQGFGKFYQYQINADLITNIYSQLMQVILFFSLLIILKMYLKFCLKVCFTSYFIYFFRKRKSKAFESLAIKLYQQNKQIKKYLNFDSINLIIDFYYANTWDLSFKVLLYLTFNQQSGIRTLVSLIFCLIYFIIGICIGVRNFEIPSNNIDFKKLKNQQHQQIIMLKKITFVLILIRMQDFSIAQCIMLSFSTCAYIGFLFILKVTNTILDLMNILCVEVSVILFTLVNLSFCKDFNNVFTPDQIIRIGFLQIACLMFGLLGPLINCVYKFYNKLKKIYRLTKPKKFQLKRAIRNIMFEVPL
ncbi:unnamed protein product (macronuclear) [Paramecium tetraurelia]|uniref:EGF-like domain-containing protein n=1 Tax=Paramecium tetraurelia TaxID=5888 RepID=A0CKA8_PARTE|nr:uncharacterized protein GSPATT00000938001 [Paramecium tetraurelia]CAK71225.1 unnamed protein product [Paramecium tetraurelia]|eukprot:XP_001438622.1 hypothetical protein (macronuclear) [Paramecium tetraurelia strain d4-2]